jgi:hypothetical protein
MSPMMSTTVANAIDPDRYPDILECMYCRGTDGHSEELWTGDKGEDDKSGFEVWFCCHACRDAKQPCETFFPVRLKPGSLAV